MRPGLVLRLAKPRVRPIAPKIPGVPGTTGATGGSGANPSTDAPARSSTGSTTPQRGGKGKWGLLFLLGGLAMASWVAKPNKAIPPAALDPFKLRVAVVFGIGNEPHAELADLARNNAEFAYIASPSAEAIGKAVEKGHTKIIVDGVSPTQLAEFERDVISCDVAFDYDGVSNDAMTRLARSRRLVSVSSSKQNLTEILRERNLI